jgi:hypothetical protein
MSKKSQVFSQNLREPLHRGATKELDDITKKLENATSSPVHDAGNSVIPKGKKSK